MARVYIVFGFTEGKWHGKKFGRALRKRGHSLARKITDADVIFAHSGGCYDVGPLRDNQLLILNNPTYWPGRSLAARAKNMLLQLLIAVRPGNRPLYHLYKSMHNIAYLPYHSRRNMFMTRRAQTFNLEQEITHHKTVLIRNNNDPWLTPDLHKLESLNPHLQIERLPGEHDDCWLHPNPYIDIMENYK